MSSMAEKMRQRIRSHAENPSRGSTVMNITPWKPDKAGTYRFDIIPYVITKPGHPDGKDLGSEFVVGDWHYRRPYATHNLRGVNAYFICPKHTFGTRCPVCEKLSEAYNEEDNVLIKEFKPKKRVLFNVVVNGDTSNIIVFDGSNFPNNKQAPAMSFGAMLEFEVKSGEEDWANFADIENGYTLKCRFIEKEFANKPYYDCDRILFEKREQKLSEDLVLNGTKLDDVFAVTSIETIQSYLGGGESKPSSAHRYDEDDVPDDFKPAPKNNIDPKDTWE